MVESDLIKDILAAGPAEINDAMLTVSRRYRELFPDWEVLFISCPKNNPQERQQTLSYIINHFEENC